MTDEIPEENVDIHKIRQVPMWQVTTRVLMSRFRIVSRESENGAKNLDLEDGILAVNIIDQFVEQNNENLCHQN